jgi:hypothetical protein
MLGKQEMRRVVKMRWRRKRRRIKEDEGNDKHHSQHISSSKGSKSTIGHVIITSKPLHITYICERNDFYLFIIFY